MKNALKNLDPDPDFVANTLPYPTSPERRLLAAFLYRAIVDCVSSAQMSKQAKRSAEAFIFGECDCVLRFEYVCGELDLNPMIVRQLVFDIQAGNRELPILAGQRRKAH